MALNLSGLASGVDTDGIVTQLMAIERQGLSKLKTRENQAAAREAGLKDVKVKLEAVKSALASLRAPGLWTETQSVTSSAATRVSGTRTADATPGVYSVTVESRAVFEQRTYAMTGAAGDLTLTPDDPAKAPVKVSLQASATATDAALAINSLTDSPVQAKVGTDGTLILTSRTSGDAGGFTVTGPASEDLAKERLGTDAHFTVDGVAKTSGSNVAKDAIPGISLNLAAVTLPGEPVTITVGDPGPQTDEIKGKFKTFVDAYNSLVDLVRDKTSEKRVINPTSNFEANRGQLFGDRGLTSMLSGMRQVITASVAGNSASLDALADLGISTGKASGGAPSDAAIAGRLTIDDAALSAALSTDPFAVQKLVGAVSGIDGFAQSFEKTIDQQLGAITSSGTRSRGLLESRLEAAPEETKRLREQQDALDRRLDAKEKRLRAQFAAMESALGTAQTQQSWLSGQIAGLANSF